MKKKLNKIGYTAEVIFDGNWKVEIRYNNITQYFYIFENEKSAVDKYNNLK